ncbi:hypothetical protein UFOVP533_11 [uncultured Caudovirales phage]|uniref:Uncharacterized protein n=1 Tax=uncultured Caudovirales phage TaxID=2100421 RepID=A0A6J5MTW7_9CAUD|nr:hypothetical protein UFOVP533_11 [uncultured Caudovirales phage]
MPNEQSAPNFFAVVNDMAKRFVELMQSDYRLKRKVGRNYTNAVSSGTLVKSLAYRLKVKGKSIDISIYAKGKASQYFLARENGRRAGATPPPVSAILDWMRLKPIKLRDKESGKFKKPTEALKRQVAFLIARKIGKEGIKGWHAFDYAMENIWDEYEAKVVEAYGKDFNAVLENQLKDI